jgi:hypothetical protein
MTSAALAPRTCGDAAHASHLTFSERGVHYRPKVVRFLIGQHPLHSARSWERQWESRIHNLGRLTRYSRRAMTRPAWCVSSTEPPLTKTERAKPASGHHEVGGRRSPCRPFSVDGLAQLIDCAASVGESGWPHGDCEPPSAFACRSPKQKA